MVRGALLLLAVATLGMAAPNVPPPAQGPVTTPAVTPATWWPDSPPADSWYPVGVLRLTNGEIVIAERYQNRIFQLATPGSAPHRLPAPGTVPIEWTAVSSAPGLSFYVLDGPGRVVHQYDFRGNYLGIAVDLEQLASDEALGGIDPAGLAVDRTGRAVITDQLGDRLLEFGPGWTFLGVWGQTGERPGSWRHPGAVAVGKAPPFLIADVGNSRLVLVDAFGEVLAVRPLATSPRGVTVLEDRRYAVSFGDEVHVLDRDLATIDQWKMPKSALCGDQPYATRALAGDRTTLLVGEGCSGRVLQLTRRVK